jgi:hypothetical protein
MTESGIRLEPHKEDSAAALVNPASGLANDYLNLFNEILMLVEQLPTMPGLMSDILAWHPMTYLDYFTTSTLPGRHLALEAYAALDQRFRKEFEQTVAELDQKAVGAVAAIRCLFKNGNEVDLQILRDMCARSADNIRKPLQKATSMVNHGARRSHESAQHRTDRLIAGGQRRAV